jgi:hypothetical protein
MLRPQLQVHIFVERGSLFRAGTEKQKCRKTALFFRLPGGRVSLFADLLHVSGYDIEAMVHIVPHLFRDSPPGLFNDFSGALPDLGGKLFPLLCEGQGSAVSGITIWFQYSLFLKRVL